MQKRRILPILHDKNFINIGYCIDIHNYNHHEAIEYAIESSKLKFDYLKQIVHITEYVDQKKFMKIQI